MVGCTALYCVQVVRRKPSEVEGGTTWTGPGLMEVCCLYCSVLHSCPGMGGKLPSVPRAEDPPHHALPRPRQVRQACQSGTEWDGRVVVEWLSHI